MNEKLRNARLKKGWSLNVASSKIGTGIHRNTLGDWERGKRKPGISLLQPLQEAYGLTLWELGLEYVVGEEIAQQQAQSIEYAAFPVEGGEKDDILGQEDLAIRLLVHVYKWSRRNTAYDDLQARIQQEIRSYDEMTDQHTPNQLENPERRHALRLLAKLPIQMYGLTALGSVATVAAEELLPHCSAGLTACWHLAGGDDLYMVRSTLTTYLPTLAALAKQQTRHQKSAAHLTAQGYLLNTILGFHLENLSVGEANCQLAVRYAEIAEDYDLQAIALRQLSNIYYYAKRPKKALETCKRTLPFITHTSSTVKSSIYASLAIFQASFRLKHDAEYSFGRAYDIFTKRPATTIMPMYADYDEAELVLCEGLTRHELGDYNRAITSLYRYGKKDTDIRVPERTHIEFLNNLALTELRRKDRDMEQCIAYWQAGMQGAVGLKSERRYNEAIEVYQSMQSVWPDEKRIADLQPQMKRWDD